MFQTLYMIIHVNDCHLLFSAASGLCAPLTVNQTLSAQSSISTALR